MMTHTLSEQAEELIFLRVQEMTPAELQASIVRCEGLTTTNCGWLEYKIRTAILDVAASELRLREREKQEAAEAG